MQAILKAKENVICASKLKSGQLAVVINCNIGCYIGRIVQPHRDTLITIGGEDGNCWDDYTRNLNENFIVRILEKGEEIVVQ